MTTSITMAMATMKTMTKTTTIFVFLFNISRQKVNRFRNLGERSAHTNLARRRWCWFVYQLAFVSTFGPWSGRLGPQETRHGGGAALQQGPFDPQGIFTATRRRRSALVDAALAAQAAACRCTLVAVVVLAAVVWLLALVLEVLATDERRENNDDQDNGRPRQLANHRHGRY